MRLKLLLAIFTLSLSSFAQDIVSDLNALVSQPAVPGRETAVTTWLTQQLKNAKTDSIGSVLVTIGSGSPHRLIVAPIDEPGFVISRITDEGYLQLQRLPQNGALPLFQELSTGQPLLIGNKNGHWSNAAMAGLSVHLQPGRKQRPDMNDIDNLYADVGATTADEVRSAGIDVLAPVALDRQLHQLGNGYLAGTAVGDRFGAAVLLELLRQAQHSTTKGTLTFAFLTQQWTGARGLVQVLNATKPDEVIFIGRFAPTAAAPAPDAQRGDSGVLIASDKPDSPLGELGDALRTIASQNNIKLTSQLAAPLIPRSYLPTPQLPARTVHLSVPIRYPVTPAETLGANDLEQTTRLVATYLFGSASKFELKPLPAMSASAPAKATTRPTITQILRTLIESYGASDHEAAVHDAVASLLPSWAKPTTNKAGDLILDWGDASKAPDLVVVAHVDEIGYEVKSVLPDGRLELEDKGGGLLPFFEGHPLLFHARVAQTFLSVPGILELPPDWQKPDFKWPNDRNVRLTADIGANNPDDVAKLGIKVGDFATVAKKFRPLLGQRASARSFDDRVGCSALIDAAWALGPSLNRRVTFVWSTGEELGLLGAAAYAKDLAAEDKAPKYVFAVDTFVSSDSPIELKRFGDALIGHGFVIRAVDNSNITPLPDVQRLRDLMSANKVPTQFGVTGGGNDGAAFVPFGTIDVAMGWPLRYSHSPAEVIDIRDLDALAHAVAAVARSW